MSGYLQGEKMWFSDAPKSEKLGEGEGRTSHNFVLHISLRGTRVCVVIVYNFQFLNAKPRIIAN